MLKVMCDFSDYKPWSGAVETYDRIENENKLDELEMLLEECYPEGITMTQINDILWFDDEWVYERLGMNQEEEEEEEEETKIYIVHSDINENNIIKEFYNLETALKYAKENIEEQTYIEEQTRDSATEEIVFSSETVWTYQDEE